MLGIVIPGRYYHYPRMYWTRSGCLVRIHSYGAAGYAASAIRDSNTTSKGLKMTIPVPAQRTNQELLRISPETGGGARRGAQVLERLRNSPPSLWYAGKPIDDATTHAATRNGFQSLA